MWLYCFKLYVHAIFYVVNRKEKIKNGRRSIPNGGSYVLKYTRYVIMSLLESDHIVPRNDSRLPVFYGTLAETSLFLVEDSKWKTGNGLWRSGRGCGRSLIKCQVTGAVTRPVIIYLRISLPMYSGGKAEKRSDVSIIRPLPSLLYHFPTMF